MTVGMDDKMTIQVNIADRFYPLNIRREDEEKIRKAVKAINEKVLQYKQKYSREDDQDFLAMAILGFVTRLIECEEKNDLTPVVNDLRDLDTTVNEFLAKIEY